MNVNTTTIVVYGIILMCINTGRNEMNIHAQNGDVVKLVNPKSGSGQDIMNTKRYLMEGDTYIVDEVEIKGMETRVWLKGYNYCSFPSAQFGDV